MSKQSVAALRALIQERFPDASPLTHRTTEHVATGITPLDDILPSGGLPRGHLTVWAPQGGAIAMLRAACDATIARWAASCTGLEPAGGGRKPSA